MKKNKILTLSIAALLGFGTVGSLGIRFASKKATVVANTSLTDTTEDKNGTGLAFPNHVRREGEATRTTIHSKLGVRSFETAEGKNSLQFVAALTGYSDLSSAKWTRTVKDYKGEVLKATEDIAISHVYTSLAAPTEVVWDTALSADTTYFYMIYTLNNIPATADYATAEVSFSATYSDGTVSTAISQKANVQGMRGEHSKQANVNIKVGLVATETSDAKYYAGKSGSDSTTTEVTIDEDFYTMNGHAAVNPGKVTALAYGTVTDTSGAFESWSKLEKINMPATITAFDKYCFTGTVLKEVEFPRDLTTIEQYAFGYASGLSTLKTVYYNAKNLKTVNGAIGNSIDVVYVSTDVESIPNVEIFKGGVGKVIYAGTEAQWAALMGTENKSGLNIDNVICSDTVTYAVTYNLEGGTFNGSEDAYTVNVKSGKTAKNVLPSKAGFKFMGWYTAAEGGELVNFEAVSAPIVAYAHWGDFPAGSTMEKAIVLTEGYKGNHEAEPGMESVWSKFTATESGTYYISQDNVTYNSENAVGSHATSAQSKIRVYDSTGEEVTYSTPDSSASKYAKVAGRCASTYGKVAIDFEAGETYYFQMYIYYSTSYPDEHAYGTFDISFGKASFTNDTPATATVINPETDAVNVSYVLGDWSEEKRYYKFTATKNATYYFAGQSEGSVWAGVYLKEANEDGSFKYSSDKLAYSYGTGSFNAINVSVEAGKTYYVVVATNSVNNNHTDEKKLGFKLSEPPVGSSKEKPISGVLAADGTDLIVSEPYGAGLINYYKVTVTTAGEYKLKLAVGGTGSLYYSSYGAIFDSTGALVGEKKGKSGSSYLAKTELAVTLEAGEYTVALGWDDSSWPSSRPLTATLGIVAPGSEIANAIEDLTDVDPTSQSITTTLKNEYHKFVAEASTGYYFGLTSTEITSYDVCDSSGNSILTVAAGQSERYALLESGKTYYVLFHGLGTGTFNVHHGAIKPDGTTRAKAYDLVVGSDNYMTLFDKEAGINDLPASGSSIYYKIDITEAMLGTYRIWSRNDGSIDTKIQGIYNGDASSYMSNTSNDDDNNAHAGYTLYKWDFYEEVSFTEAGTYTFCFKAITKTAVGTATYLKYGFEAISLLNPPAVDPGTPDVPDTPVVTGTHVGTWTTPDGDTIIINEDGTISINGEGATYTIDDNYGTISGGDNDTDQFEYDPETDKITLYFYGNGSYGLAAFDVECTRAGTTTPDTSEAPAFCGSYTGTVGANGGCTLVLNADHTASYNGASWVWIADGNNISMENAADEDLVFTLVWNETAQTLTGNYVDAFEGYNFNASFAKVAA